MDSTEHLFGQLHNTIRSANRILLVAHKKPDGDTLGSSSSVLNWLIREGKDVTVFCKDEPPAAFRYIDNIHRYTSDTSVFDHAYDLVIVFDSSDLRYCGVDAHIPRLPKGFMLVNIDHHATNQRYGQVNIVLTDASSTAEVVHRFYEANRIAIDARMATSLLTGLLTDTSSFSNAATNAVSMDAAGKLLSAGARLHDIRRHVFLDKTIPMLRIWGICLSRLRISTQTNMAITYLRSTDLDGASTDVVDGISNFLNSVVGEAETILVLFDQGDGLIKGSFRSVTRDISKIAKLLGGGGHKKAAGFTVAGKIEETKEGPRIVRAT